MKTLTTKEELGQVAKDVFYEAGDDEEKDGPLALGLHKKGYFHEVVDMDKCLIVHPDFDKVRIKTREYFQGIPFYNRRTHEGVLRHLAIRRTASGGNAYQPSHIVPRRNRHRKLCKSYARIGPRKRNQRNPPHHKRQDV